MPKKQAKNKRVSATAASLKASAKPAAVRKGDAGTAKDKALRKHLVNLLTWSDAHVDFEKTIAGLPAELRGVKPQGMPHTAWQLLEHLRICQWDILEFSRNPKYVSLKWPEGYWPQNDAPPNEAGWEQSVEAFRADLKAMKKLVQDPSTNLFARIPHGDGQTILREALLLADHNGYHLGQLVVLRRLLGVWHAS